MINAAMREYPYYLYSGSDEYGQPQLSPNAVGSVKMAINLQSQNSQQNIMYSDANYVGLTHNTEVNDAYVIEYGKERLKVLYVSTHGRMRQVYMARMV